MELFNVGADAARGDFDFVALEGMELSCRIEKGRIPENEARQPGKSASPKAFATRCGADLTATLHDMNKRHLFIGASAQP